MSVVYASSHIEAAQSMVSKIEEVILFPILSFMLALALLYFLWGAYEFVANADSDSGRDTGKTHMMYGIIGMVIMVSALAILQIAAGTFGIDVETN
jgi:hypothetical protein